MLGVPDLRRDLGRARHPGAAARGQLRRRTLRPVRSGQCGRDHRVDGGLAAELAGRPGAPGLPGRVRTGVLLGLGAPAGGRLLLLARGALARQVDDLPVAARERLAQALVDSGKLPRPGGPGTLEAGPVPLGESGAGRPSAISLTRWA